MCIVGNATFEISSKLDCRNGSDLRVINVLVKDVDVRIIDGLKRFTELRSARQIFILFHYDLLIVQFQSDRVLLAQNVIKIIELQISVNATKELVLDLFTFGTKLVCLFCFCAILSKKRLSDLIEMAKRTGINIIYPVKPHTLVNM